ncbi:hypothetical protein A2767_04665 [Candidatus Roizmanbacteria bacterium RIFCSPHIGHO2_01_FULL_35_10]|uniref:Uncharacterized protein n=1 Tax=Candidatus Roizmanbacteria bacterium RIFCSPLOWO2_01_FULL_35_13 TaxID=1802055 RepID=A0A1F7I708_9BACT|nr:MAG: hypothetical protein A2767_04665 [Candidatus Roizmanbacteria bacterium RIFCSPHIGHO2_01_FULL_35_10]OGK39159.1 MAG: hypothetical protein A3A74_03630 [Candidatus Roizmanbacteria bacterium RIFCSPLOWO2_01_FULL_35_13]
MPDFFKVQGESDPRRVYLYLGDDGIGLIFKTLIFGTISEKFRVVSFPGVDDVFYFEGNLPDIINVYNIWLSEWRAGLSKGRK